MRDGTELSGILYLPADDAPAPAIFLLTPYIAQTFHEEGQYFARAGYPFLVVDMRGRGNSPGDFLPYRSERRDGYDVVEWLAGQPYCDGRVTAWGGSYGGYTQWAAAAERPPHLATIVPVSAPFRGIDAPVRNNSITLDRLAWANLVAGRTSQDRVWADSGFWADQLRRFHESGRPFREVDTFVGAPSAMFQEWVEHVSDGDFWDAFNPSAEDFAGLALPILTITGHYDVSQPGALEHYAQHTRYGTPECVAAHHLVIGPWDHAGTRVPQREFGGLRVGPAAMVDMRALHLEWYAWILRGGPRPDLLRDRVAYYVLGAEEWRSAGTLEAATSRTLSLLLASDGNPTDVFAAGALVVDGAEPTGPEATGTEATGPDHFVYDPRDVSTARLEATVDPGDLRDQRMLFARRGKLLVYHSEPFDELLEVTGFVRVTLWIGIDQPDTDLRVSVHEIAIDGSSLLLTSDTLRARHRQSLREEHLVETEEPLSYEFVRFPFVSRELAVGSRLRLVVEPVNSIYALKNYNAGGAVVDESMADARPVTVRVFHDDGHASVLHIPMGRGRTP
jgi:putative CocE/NonD family hydrolase